MLRLRVSYLLVIAGAIVVSLYATRLRATSSRRDRSAPRKVDLVVVAVAMPARARPFVAGRLTGPYEDTDPIARGRKLRDLVDLLRDGRGAWEHGAVRDTVPMEARLVGDAFARVKGHVESQEASHASNRPRDYRQSARPEAGFAVLHAMVAVRGHHADVQAEPEAAVDEAIARLSWLAAESLERVAWFWSPADPDARFTADELRAVHPELHPISAARLELEPCPQCGAHDVPRGACRLCGHRR
jgi:hypothetical protein